MDFTAEDMRRMRTDGDHIAFIRLHAGLAPAHQAASQCRRRCPRCGAPPGQRCTTHRGKRLTAGIHEARTASE